MLTRRGLLKTSAAALASLSVPKLLLSEVLPDGISPGYVCPCTGGITQLNIPLANANQYYHGIGAYKNYVRQFTLPDANNMRAGLAAHVKDLSANYYEVGGSVQSVVMDNADAARAFNYWPPNSNLVNRAFNQLNQYAPVSLTDVNYYFAASTPQSGQMNAPQISTQEAILYNPYGIVDPGLGAWALALNYLSASLGCFFLNTELTWQQWQNLKTEAGTLVQTGSLLLLLEPWLGEAGPAALAMGTSAMQVAGGIMGLIKMCGE